MAKCPWCPRIFPNRKAVNAHSGSCHFNPRKSKRHKLARTKALRKQLAHQMQIQKRVRFHSPIEILPTPAYSNSSQESDMDMQDPLPAEADIVRVIQDME